MVEEHCSVPFQFKVITEDPDRFPEWGVPFSREVVWTDTIACKKDHRMVMNRGKPQGCWGKLDAFLPSFGPGPVMCLDLDITILDDIAPLISDTLRMPWQGSKFNGSIYSFTPSEETARLYPELIPYDTHPRGEQEFVQESYGRVRPLDDCYSYKIHIASRYGRNPPPGARIIYHHGYPTPASDSVQFPWISRTWRGLKRRERI